MRILFVVLSFSFFLLFFQVQSLFVLKFQFQSVSGFFIIIIKSMIIEVIIIMKLFVVLFQYLLLLEQTVQTKIRLLQQEQS